MRCKRMLICIQLVKPHDIAVGCIVMKDVGQRSFFGLSGCQSWLDCLTKGVTLSVFDLQFHCYSYFAHHSSSLETQFFGEH